VKIKSRESGPAQVGVQWVYYCIW